MINVPPRARMEPAQDLEPEDPLLRSGVGALARADYQLDNAFEPRLGLEFSRRVKAVSLQLRGGIHSQAPGSLRYTRPDTPEAEAFQGSKPRLLTAVGASLVTSFGLRIELASIFAGEATVMTAGVVLRL